MKRPPNPRLQRTGSRPPLSRQPLGALGNRVRLALGATVCIAAVVLGSPEPKAESVADAVKRFESHHPGVRHVAGTVVGPKLVRKREPDFPEASRKKRRILSPIFVEAVVTETGDIADPTVMSSENADLHPAVLSAVRQWKYEPAREKGKPVPVFLVVLVNF